MHKPGRHRAVLDHLSVVVLGGLNALELSQGWEAGAVRVPAQLWELATNIIHTVAYLVVIVEAAGRPSVHKRESDAGLQL